MVHLYINNDHTNVISSIKMSLNSKQRKSQEHRKERFFNLDFYKHALENNENTLII